MARTFYGLAPLVSQVGNTESSWFYGRRQGAEARKDQGVAVMMILEAIRMNSPQIRLEQLLYDSFTNIFEVRLKAQQNSPRAVGEIKAVEDTLWRLFIRNAYRDPQACLCERAA
jgi:hypothetical protein